MVSVPAAFPALVRLSVHKWRRAPVLIGALLLILLSVFVVMPLWELIRIAGTYSARDLRLVRDAEVGAWTAYHFTRVMTGDLGRALLWKPLWNSVVVSLGTTGLSLTAGGLLALLVVRTDMRFARAVNALALLPYMLPSWVIALAWLVVFKNERLGGVPGLAAAAFGVQTPNWLAYGIVPIVIALSLHYFAFAYLFISNALESMNAEFEETAETLGARRWRIQRRITFPLVLPAIGSAAILTISRSLGTFGTPAFLGMPVREYTLSTQIYAMLAGRFFGDAFVLILVLVALAAFSLYVNARVLGVRKSFVTVGGRGGRTRRMRLGRLRTPLGAGVLLVVGVAAVGPLGVLALETLLRIPGLVALDNLTLHYWIGASHPTIAGGIPGVFHNPIVWSSMRSSLRLAGAVALVAGVAGFLAAYAIVRIRGSLLARVLEIGTFVPYIFPSIAFGGIYLSLFATGRGPIPALYGTFLLLVVVCVVKNLTYTTQAGAAAMLQIDRSLEESAESLGAAWPRRMRRILLPLTRGGVVLGMLLTFVTVMRELSLIILLATPTVLPLTALVFQYEDRGMVQHGHAVVLILVVLVLAAGLAVNRLRRSVVVH